MGENGISGDESEAGPGPDGLNGGPDFFVPNRQVKQDTC